MNVKPMVFSIIGALIPITGFYLYSISVDVPRVPDSYFETEAFSHIPTDANPDECNFYRPYDTKSKDAIIFNSWGKRQDNLLYKRKGHLQLEQVLIRNIRLRNIDSIAKFPVILSDSQIFEKYGSEKEKQEYKQNQDNVALLEAQISELLKSNPTKYISDLRNLSLTEDEKEIAGQVIEKLNHIASLPPNSCSWNKDKSSVENAMTRPEGIMQAERIANAYAQFLIKSGKSEEGYKLLVTIQKVNHTISRYSLSVILAVIGISNEEAYLDSIMSILKDTQDRDLKEKLIQLIKDSPSYVDILRESLKPDYRYVYSSAIQGKRDGFLFWRIDQERTDRLFRARIQCEIEERQCDFLGSIKKFESEDSPFHYFYSLRYNSLGEKLVLAILDTTSFFRKARNLEYSKKQILSGV